MAKTYPTCQASNADPINCKREADGEGLNYATVAWANPMTAVIISEVPCSSSWGGIMCQVEAYQFDTRNRTITARMTAQEFQRQWQSSLAFKFHVLDLPEWKHPKKDGPIK